VHHGPRWVVTSFDSSAEDPRDYLRTEYGGLTFHIKPGHGDAVNVISVFVEHPKEIESARLTINRFLSAMAWKDGYQYVTLGHGESGASLADKETPRFNHSEGRLIRHRVIDQFDFEFLQDPPHQKQKLALALYREGLNSNLPFYQLLSFYKIINVGFRRPEEQMAWINANLEKVRDSFGMQRLEQLLATVSDVGKYLYVQGRTAIAHAFSDPIKDPDAPVDVLAATRETDLMKSLAQIFIQDELGVPSLNKIFSEHFYELAGFKDILGESLTGRLQVGENVPLTEFPKIPPLTFGMRIRLQDGLRYPWLTALPFRVASCVGGRLVLETDDSLQPIRACLHLDFPKEELEFVLTRFGINGKLNNKNVEICWYQFLMDYFSNGSLRIFDAITSKRLSHKLAFLPINIDPSATVEGWQKRITELESQ
jgi:hypothetical protein